jgi:glycosyltransferase involved in cell wall biosynthesis
MYKGPDVLIKAVGRCVRRGLDLQLTVVGDGRFRPTLEALAHRVDCASRVHFVGQLSSPEAVRPLLDGSHIFVLPSRTEGLPRALIEAMARGLPCIATRVGGIPELLADEDLVESGSVEQLARKIEELARDPARSASSAQRNFRTAQEYRDDILSIARRRFYAEVRQRTEQWLERSVNADEAS